MAVDLVTGAVYVSEYGVEGNQIGRYHPASNNYTVFLHLGITAQPMEIVLDMCKRSVDDVC